MKTVYDLIIEERERNKPTANCDICGLEYDKIAMWTSGNVYRCDKCFKWKDEWFDIFPSLDIRLVQLAVAYLYENKRVMIYTGYPYRYIFSPEYLEHGHTQLKLPIQQKNDMEKYCEIKDNSKLMFKDKKDYEARFSKLSPIENSIVVHWRSHPDSKSYFDAFNISMWAGCNIKVAEEILDGLVKLGFIKKIDNTKFKTTDINYAIHGI